MEILNLSEIMQCTMLTGLYSELPGLSNGGNMDGRFMNFPGC